MGYAVKTLENKVMFVNDNHEEIPFDTVIGKLNPTVREYINENFGREKFENYPVFMEYCKEHKKKFGKEFEF